MATWKAVLLAYCRFCKDDKTIQWRRVSRKRYVCDDCGHRQNDKTICDNWAKRRMSGWKAA